MKNLFIKSILAPALFLTSLSATDVQEKIVPVAVNPVEQAHFQKELRSGLQYAQDRYPWAYSDERLYQVWHYSSRGNTSDPRDLIATIQAVQPLSMSELMGRLQLLADTSDTPLIKQDFEQIGWNLGLIRGGQIDTLRMLASQFNQVYGYKISIARIVYTNFNFCEDTLNTSEDYISSLLTAHRWFASKNMNPIRDWRLINHEFISEIMKYSDETLEEIYQRIQALELGVPIKYGYVFLELCSLVEKYTNAQQANLKLAVHKLIELRLLSTDSSDNRPEELHRIIKFLNNHPNPLSLTLDELAEAYRGQEINGLAFMCIWLKP